MPKFVTQRDLYEVRERPSKAYSWKAFLIANIVVEIPYQTLLGILVYAACKDTTIHSTHSNINMIYRLLCGLRCSRLRTSGSYPSLLHPILHLCQHLRTHAHRRPPRRRNSWQHRHADVLAHPGLQRCLPVALCSPRFLEYVTPSPRPTP